MTLERTPVFVLFRVGCPFAIVGRITSFVIDAFKCKARRLLAHVREKVFKAVQPAVTNSNAAGGVVKEILLAVRVVAARFHVRPCAKRSAPAAGRMPVGAAMLSSYFLQKAPTRACVATSQIASTDACFSAAFTTAFPVNDNDTRRASMSMRDTKYGQSAVLLACDIIQFGHRAGSTVRGQVTARPCKVWPLRLA